MNSDLNVARERYHIAKLALFNVRLLSAIQHEESEEIKRLVARTAYIVGFKETPSLLHQTTFLQFAYVCFVWLWESVKKAGLEIELLEEFPKITARYEVKLPSTEQILGERTLQNWKDVLTLLRNALSHGSVNIYEDMFLFHDQKKKKELNPTTLSLSWEQLGLISELCIHALTPTLWPQTNNHALPNEILPSP